MHRREYSSIRDAFGSRGREGFSIFARNQWGEDTVIGEFNSMLGFPQYTHRGEPEPDSEVYASNGDQCLQLDFDEFGLSSIRSHGAEMWVRPQCEPLLYGEWSMPRRTAFGSGRFGNVAMTHSNDHQYDFSLRNWQRDYARFQIVHRDCAYWGSLTFFDSPAWRAFQTQYPSAERSSSDNVIINDDADRVLLKMRTI